jgi:hypothetical protein
MDALCDIARGDRTVPTQSLQRPSLQKARNRRCSS